MSRERVITKLDRDVSKKIMRFKRRIKNVVDDMELFIDSSPGICGFDAVMLDDAVEDLNNSIEKLEEIQKDQ